MLGGETLAKFWFCRVASYWVTITADSFDVGGIHVFAVSRNRVREFAVVELFEKQRVAPFAARRVFLNAVASQNAARFVDRHTTLRHRHVLR